VNEIPKTLIQGIGLYYEVTGSGEPLVFVHGLGSSTRDWEYQVPFFSPKYKVITVDLRGHGKSDKPKAPYSIPMFAKDIAGLIKNLDLKDVNIVGISLGGAIVMQLTINYPELIKNLVVVNSSAAVMDPNALKETINSRTEIIKNEGMEGMGRTLASVLFIKPDQEESRKKVIKRWAENDADAYISSLSSLNGFNIKNHLNTIKCPTLIVTSDEDYTPVSIKEEYAKLIPNSRVYVVNDARHALTMERPKEFNDLDRVKIVKKMINAPVIMKTTKTFHSTRIPIKG
jgi:pimeloyl-ACP methyl ester carboxylesterase